MIIDNNYFNYGKLIEFLNTNVNFSFSRFGDGEFNCAFGKKGQNCDGHEYFEDLSQELIKILNSKQKYFFGLQNLGYNIWKDKIDQLKDIRFCDADILHKASIKNSLNYFLDALKSKNIILIAPEYFKNFEKINTNNHIIIPEKNCWLSKNDTIELLEKKITKNCVVLYSASMMSNFIIEHIFTNYENEITQIDCGSVFDPYLGVSKRMYHQSIIDRIKK